MKLVLSGFDLGLARSFDNTEEQFEHGSIAATKTLCVQAQSYRAPELVLEVTNKYSADIDMWSVGLIFLEFFIGNPLFCKNDIEDHVQDLIKNMGAIPYFDKVPVNTMKRIKDDFKLDFQVRKGISRLPEKIEGYLNKHKQQYK